MSQMTSAMFDHREDARRGIHALRDHGISEERISVVAMADDGSGKASDLDASERTTAPGKGDGISVTTPEDAGKGAAEGAAIGGGLGILAALSSIFVPGFGLVTAGGALAAAIGAAVATAVGGAVVGGITGYLVDMGVPEHAAQGYEAALKSGGILVTVFPNDDATTGEVEQILAKYGGHSALSHPTNLTNPDELDARNHHLLAGDALTGADETNLMDEDPLDAVTGSEGSASSRVNAARVGP